MNAAEVLAGMRRHVLLIVVAVLLGVGGAGAVTMMQQPEYESQATVFVSVSEPAQRLDQAYQGTLFTQERVRSYADLVTSPQITQGVVQELHLPTTADELAGRLSATAPIDTVLLHITASDTNAQRAAAIVNSVTRRLIELVAGLEGAPTVRLQVVRPGTAAGQPSSPRPMLNLLLGLVVGALAGLGAGLLKDALDTRIGGAEDVALVGEQPVLGAVPYDPEAKTSPLTDPADPFGSRAEAFRKLRTNLAFLRIDGPPRSIAVTSPLQGDGKSSTALNLAFSLADSGYRVALVDADLRRPSIATTLGLVGEAGLTSVLIGRAALSEVLQTATRGSQIQVLTSGPLAPNPSELLATVQFRQVLAGLKGQVDYVIVDAAPLLPVADGSIVAAAVDGAILVVRARRTRREDLRRALEALTGVDSRVVGIVLNMVARRKTSGYSGYAGGQPQPVEEELERV